MAASSCSPSLTPPTAHWIMTSSEGSPPPGRWSNHSYSHQTQQNQSLFHRDRLWSLRCPPSTHTQSSTSAGRTSSPSTSTTRRSSTRRFARSRGSTWVCSAAVIPNNNAPTSRSATVVTVTVICSGSLQTLGPPSLIKLLIMSSAITAKCSGGSLCAPLIAWDIKRLSWYTYTHTRIWAHTPGFTWRFIRGRTCRRRAPSTAACVNQSRCAQTVPAEAASPACCCVPGVLTRWAFLLMEAERRTTRSSDEWRKSGFFWVRIQ